MFSNRTNWDRARNRLAEAIATCERAQRPLLDLTESNPTRVGLECPLECLTPLADPSVRGYAPAPRGPRIVREAVAADYARRGYTVDPERLVLTASTSEAYALLFKLLADPGDVVLVPRPSYPLFEFLATLESVQIRPYPLAYDGEWHLELAALPALVTERTRAIVVVNPNNPTGSYLKRDETSALLELCAGRGLALISDEVFADYSFGEDTRRQTSIASGGPALVFALGGLSKSCGLPQLKLGWIAVAGPASLVDEALARLDIMADSYLSVSTPVLTAAPALLARLPQLLGPVAERVRSNHRLLESLLARSASPATLLRAEGGWYGVLRVPATHSEEERVVRLLEQHGVLVHPGFFFDFPHEAYLVLSLLPRPGTFQEGVARVLRSIEDTG